MAAQANLKNRPIRVGVYDTVAQARDAVDGLLRAGFMHDQITVVCSDETRERHFQDFAHQQPAGANTPAAAGAGGALGAILGGLVAVAGVATTGGLGVFAIGPLFAGTGAVVGGLIGAMMTRGVDKELANYYDQAVTRGKILVAAEDHSADRVENLARAEQVLEAAGAEPVELKEG